MNFRPLLVRDVETGKICIQITLGEWTETRELPDTLATYDARALNLYMQSVVPGMIEILEQKSRAKRKQMNRKVKKCSIGRSKSMDGSPAKILSICPPDQSSDK